MLLAKGPFLGIEDTPWVMRPPNPACSTILQSPDLNLFHAVEFRFLPAKQEFSALQPVLETLAHLMSGSPLSLMLW